MIKKMMVIEFLRVEDGEGQPAKIWKQAFTPHLVSKFDMVETVIIRQVGRGKLDQRHAGDKDQQQQKGQQPVEKNL